MMAWMMISLQGVPFRRKPWNVTEHGGRTTGIETRHHAPFVAVWNKQLDPRRLLHSTQRLLTTTQTVAIIRNHRRRAGHFHSGKISSATQSTSSELLEAFPLVKNRDCRVKPPTSALARGATTLSQARISASDLASPFASTFSSYLNSTCSMLNSSCTRCTQ